MFDVSDAIDKLLEKVRSDVAARIVRRVQPVEAVESALLAYRRAIEGEVASTYARDHSLPSPGHAPDPVATAEALRRAVEALPELAGAATKAQAPGALPKPPAESDAPSETSSAPATEKKPQTRLPVEWGPLIRLLQSAPLVLVGGVVRDERIAFMPREIRARIEWIDTTRQGTHAIGNLAQRIKVGRVAALVLMEGLLGHRHSEPLVLAARAASVPIAYAGKGGQAALARAFISINQKATSLEEDG